MTTSTSITGSPEASVEIALQYIPYIQYPIQFWKNQVMEVKTLLNSISGVNIINLVFIVKLRLGPRFTNINVKKIDGLVLGTYGIISTVFSF